MCSRQKSPATWQCLHNYIPFCKLEYGLTFKIHPASSKWKPISISMNLCFANGRSSFQKNKTYAWRHKKPSNVRLRDSRWNLHREEINKNVSKFFKLISLKILNKKWKLKSWLNCCLNLKTNCIFVSSSKNWRK